VVADANLGNIAIGYGALDSLQTGESNIAIGLAAMDATTGAVSNCVVIGERAGDAINHTDSNGTVAIGYYALSALVSGIGNTAVGYQAMDVETNGDHNTAVGYQALSGQDGGAGAGGGTVGNTAVGYQAGLSIGGGRYNVAIGAGAFKSDDDSDATTAIGYNALASYNHNTGTAANVAVGTDAMSSATTAINCTAVGHAVMSGAALTGNNNTAVGKNALLGIIGAANCTAVGKSAGEVLSNSADNSTLVGYDAGAGITSGANNVCVGKSAGDVITDGTSNTCIGTSADPHADGAVSQIVIGEGATGVDNYYAVIGNASTTRLYASQDAGATVYAAGQSWSDKRIKENVKDIGLGLDFVNKLEPIQYTQKQPIDYDQSLKEKMPWYGKEDPRVITDSRKSRIRPGLLAQDVLKVLEELEFSSNTSIVQIDKKTTQHSMDYSSLVIPLIKAVQELSEQNKVLEKRIEELEN